MHSWPIMVESMSARKSILRRPSARCTTTSIGAPASAARTRSANARIACAWGFPLSPVKGMSAADAGIEPDRRLRRRQRAARALDRGGVERRRRGIGDQGRDQVSWPGEPPSKRAVLIAGPTASGKSALALELAQRLGGTVINANSMQVYRDLRVITARPSPAEEARVPHLLYGHVDAAENYSVGRWCVDAAAALAEAERAGRLPIMVGGTGLYFKTLTRGLAAVPPIPAAIRTTVRERLAAEGIAPLYAELGDARSRDRVAADAGRPRPRHPRAGSGAGDRALADGLARRGHAAGARCGCSGQGLPRRRAGRALPPHRCPLRCHARRGRARGGARARRPAASMRRSRP